jgi:hypothetical protein
VKAITELILMDAEINEIHFDLSELLYGCRFGKPKLGIKRDLHDLVNVLGCNKDKL